KCSFCQSVSSASKPMAVRGAAAISPLLLDRVPDQRSDVGAAEALDLADAGRRGDVDLGEVVADHVDADEEEAALAQLRADSGADLLVACGHLDCLGP